MLFDVRSTQIFFLGRSSSTTMKHCKKSCFQILNEHYQLIVLTVGTKCRNMAPTASKYTKNTTNKSTHYEQLTKSES